MPQYSSSSSIPSLPYSYPTAFPTPYSFLCPILPLSIPSPTSFPPHPYLFPISPLLLLLLLPHPSPAHPLPHFSSPPPYLRFIPPPPKGQSGRASARSPLRARQLGPARTAPPRSSSSPGVDKGQVPVRRGCGSDPSRYFPRVAAAAWGQYAHPRVIPPLTTFTYCYGG